MTNRPVSLIDSRNFGGRGVLPGPRALSGGEGPANVVNWQPRTSHQSESPLHFCTDNASKTPTGLHLVNAAQYALFIGTLPLRHVAVQRASRSGVSAQRTADALSSLFMTPKERLAPRRSAILGLSSQVSVYSAR
jgi:hypothetical protein